jgi:hypothetical protein
VPNPCMDEPEQLVLVFVEELLGDADLTLV